MQVSCYWHEQTTYLMLALALITQPSYVQRACDAQVTKGKEDTYLVAVNPLDLTTLQDNSGSNAPT